MSGRRKSVRFAEDSVDSQLCNAIENCYVQEVKRLVELGANPNGYTDAASGITPMHWACGLGDTPVQIEIVEHLLLHSGNPNVRSAEGLTPVHIASSWGFFSILKVLIDFGGNPWLEDDEGYNAWDLALQKTQWNVLKFLATYMDKDEDCHEWPKERPSINYRFSQVRKVSDSAFLYNSSLAASSSNVGFLESNCSNISNSSSNSSILNSSCSTLNDALCSSSSSNPSIILVEEYVYSDEEKGVDLIEWHYPPIATPDSVSPVDATLNEAICSSDSDEKNSMDSQLLIEELRALGSNPGPITATTKQIYLRQLYRLRKDHAGSAPSPQRIGNSKELLDIIQSYPGSESETKVATRLDRLFVTHFTCPDPAKPWREGLSKKSFNYILMDPRMTHNLPMNESQDQAKLFQKFVASIFYIGKGKQTRSYEHLYEAIKIRSRPQSALLKISSKVKRILDIWNDSHGVISLHVFQNSLPVEAYCREAAMIEAVGINSITNVKRGDYYGICTTWSNADKRRWGSHLLYKAFHIFLHEGERQIRPVDL